MPNPEFVHLHCHSEYSVNSSLVRIPDLVNKTKDLGMSAVALTDKFNMFAAVKLYKEAKSNGVKPIFGSQVEIKHDAQHYPLILLCQDHQGYLNLSKIISLAYMHAQSVDGVTIDLQTLKKHHHGLIAISPAVKGDVATMLLKGQINEASNLANLYQSIFGDRYYLSVQRTGRVNDEKHLHLCTELAIKAGIAITASNDVEFLEKSEFDAHEARICISDGLLIDDSRRDKRHTQEQYLKSAEQMHTLFSDLPEALENTLQIAKRCNVHFELYQKNYLPDFPVPSGLSVAQFFEQQSRDGLESRLKGQKLDKSLYQKRLEYEISVIIKMDFPGYFLIVADFIRWSRENEIPVGPGRGSGAGSLVAYALGITNVDPIKHELLFERFLNPERVSMPDFDVDFCTDHRDEVIAYVSNKYGQEKVSQIITYGTMAAKGVVRDVGRVLGHPYGFSDKISKLIPNDLKMTLSKALSPADEGGSDELRARYESEESVTTLIDLSKQLEGLVRNVGTHAGGVLIAPRKISDFCPTYKASETDGVVSQFDMKDIEALGLVKFDFLGLSNLTVIDKALKTISEKSLSQEVIDINDIPLDDAKVYQLLQRCDTTGVFQLEGGGMRGYLKKMKPDSFDDVVAMLALYRPGPLDSGMVDDYIDVKHGRKKPAYPHPLLEDVLKPTNGVFVYQEQVMKSAQVLADYSLGAADLLRRAMGKKIPEEMSKQRGIFVAGAAKKNNINEKKANQIFDLIDKFSGYGFNKSHSVAYAYISYQTAWLKTHYPAAFMASVLSGMMDDSDRVAFTVNEIRQSDLKITAPNVNLSNYEFGITDENTITYGLGAIKGVGEAMSHSIALERERSGEYKDLFDFCLRLEKKHLNRRAMLALIYSGAFDVFGVERATLITTFPKAVAQAEQQQKDSLNGQSGLFSGGYKAEYVISPNLSFRERLSLEKNVMGYYFFQHPTDEYKPDLKNIGATLPSKLSYRNNKDVRVVALISEIRYINTKKGNQMAELTIEDGNAKTSAIVYAKTLSNVSDKLNIDEVVLISGKVRKDFRDNWQISVESVNGIDEVKASYAKSFEIILGKKHQTLFTKIADALKQSHGRCPVQISYTFDGISGCVPLNQDYLVTPNQALTDLVDGIAKDKVSIIHYH